MEYEGSIYRPPSEASSLLLQATIGCSHNKCTFCGMYKDKQFRIRPVDDVIADIINLEDRTKRQVRRVFLCDGNALVMKTAHLQDILSVIKQELPHCERVGVYAAPADILRKTTAELTSLRELGLQIAYIGLESGSDDVLALIRKGATKQDMLDASAIIRPSGILQSVMVITGIGGQALWEAHALETAEALNGMQPDFLGLLALMVEPGTPLSADIDAGRFKLLTPKQIVQEMRLMVAGLELKDCLFSSIHASNYINLRGRLPADKARLIRELDHYLQNENLYRPEYFRQL